jgi:hypothetical protein
MKYRIITFAWLLISPFTYAQNNEVLDLKPDGMIKIGPKREYTSLGDFFSKNDKARNVYLVIDDGTYYESRLHVRAEDVIIEGTGLGVNIYCTEYGENVMEISGRNIYVKNLRLKHFKPGSSEEISCTGHVIMLDNAENVTIENCDLNGCGLSALHDNVSNSNILIKNCYIHNNSLGAFTNSDGEVWMKETENHSVFRFENNRIENNGVNRIKETDEVPEDASNDDESENQSYMANEIEYWKDVPNPLIVKYTGIEWGDCLHLLFEDKSGMVYDFGFGNNNFGNYQLYDNETSFENPKYLNQTFKLHWKWIMSTYPCCDGEYNETKGLQPSIIKLELIESNTQKK